MVIQMIFLLLKLDQKYVFEIGRKPIPAISTVKLLGNTIDSKLKLSHHLDTLSTNAEQTCIL